jgi:hypothetical protein
VHIQVDVKIVHKCIYNKINNILQDILKCLVKELHLLFVNIIYVISVIIMLCSDFQKLLLFVVVRLVIIIVEFLVGRSCFPEASCWDVL